MPLESQPLLNKTMKLSPKAPWADAIPSSRDPKRLLPQTIGHRGYKAKYPENTILAFQGAVDAGAHAIETDMHLTADGVVVMSHDATGKRCFGVNKKIRDCTWEDIQWWRTLREPHEPMPRLENVLAWLAEPQNDKIWMVLDIKVDDPADELVGAIAQVLSKAPASRPWNERVVLGCWNATFVTAARSLLPTYPLVHISISTLYSLHFFCIPSMGVNMLQRSLIGPVGWWFMRKVRKDGRQLFVWTVNDERWMEWCVRKNVSRRELGGKARDGTEKDDVESVRAIDGVITDDPGLFREVCERWEDEQDGKLTRVKIGSVDRVRQGLGTTLLSVGVHVAVFLLLVRNFYLGRVDFFKGGDERRS